MHFNCVQKYGGIKEKSEEGMCSLWGKPCGFGLFGFFLFCFVVFFFHLLLKFSCRLASNATGYHNL